LHPGFVWLVGNQFVEDLPSNMVGVFKASEGWRMAFKLKGKLKG